ncbi:unnamed protein product [Prorocentrum cordatum]|uniref:C3H1-type domain-containing protein n=1 Tax=Prorocentrum cordatum TaxID=2364126 RepID=A0ABN9Q848_9DINO|nr:unnamed protein product [Polarella glacialis]
MAKPDANYCRLYQRSECLRGSECPMLHAVHLTTGAAPAHSQSSQTRRDDISEGFSMDSSSEDNWTSSSGSRSWADMSEGLWTVQRAGLPRTRPAAEPPRAWSARAASSRDEFPSFDERISHIPEFMPSESRENDAAGYSHKSKSAIRRRQRQMTVKWAAMREVNSTMSLPVMHALSGMPSSLPPARYSPRTESASPERPPAPAPSPRRPRRMDDHDPGDSCDDGHAFENTKVSL